MNTDIEKSTGFAELNDANKDAILLMAATFAHSALSLEYLFDKLDTAHKDEIKTMIRIAQREEEKAEE